MSNHSTRQLLDDRLEALGRLERRRLLLRLSRARRHDELRIDFGERNSDARELDSLVMMRHLHLPNLEERGFIRWDRENDGVTKGPRFDEIEPFLQVLREVENELPGGWV